MEPRFDLPTTVPEAYRRVAALDQVGRDRIDHRLLELVKLRASMMNGCSFCVDMHGTDLLAAGEPARRVLAVAAWRESTLFTERERIVLELTEAVTRLDRDGVPDEVWAAAVDELGERLAADIVVAIATINVWNRLAITARAPTPPLEPA